MARHRGHAQWSVLEPVLAVSRERPEKVGWLKGAAILVDERPDVGSNRAVAGPADDSSGFWGAHRW